MDAIGERDLIDVAILCAGGPAAIASAFAAVRPGGTVVASASPARRRSRSTGTAWSCATST